MVLGLGRGNLKLSSDVTDHILPFGSSGQYSSQIVSGFPVGFAFMKEEIVKAQINGKGNERSILKVLSNRS